MDSHSTNLEGRRAEASDEERAVWRDLLGRSQDERTEILFYMVYDLWRYTQAVEKRATNLEAGLLPPPPATRPPPHNCKPTRNEQVLVDMMFEIIMRTATKFVDRAALAAHYCSQLEQLGFRGVAFGSSWCVLTSSPPTKESS